MFASFVCVCVHACLCMYEVSMRSFCISICTVAMCTNLSALLKHFAVKDLSSDKLAEISRIQHIEAMQA